MTNHRPWLSVIMPTWNSAPFLPETLKSLLNQKEKAIEVIAIDDGSTDSTVRILENFSIEFPIHIVELRHTGNWVANTNLGLSMASGRYISFLHQDDIWMPGRLNRLKQLVTKHPEINFILHPSFFIDQKGNITGVLTCPLPKRPNSIPPDIVIPRLLIQNFISISAPCFKKSMINKIGKLDKDLWYSADWKFWLKLAYQEPLFYYPVPLSCMRVHASSLTVSGSTCVEAFKMQMETVLDQCLPQFSKCLADQQKIKRIATFSICINSVLAAIVWGKSFNLRELLILWKALRLKEWYDYINFSRIHERVLARIKSGLLNAVVKQ